LKIEIEAEEAAREDLTVMMYCLPGYAGEEEIYKFFKAECDVKIRDI
jgi:RNA-binding protein 23/39